MIAKRETNIKVIILYMLDTSHIWLLFEQNRKGSHIKVILYIATLVVTSPCCVASVVEKHAAYIFAFKVSKLTALTCDVCR
jgi:hypothetical protein